MKQLINGFSFKHFATLVMLCLIQTIVFAQDGGSGSSGGSTGGTSSGSSSSTTTSITTSSDTWYAQPWVWVVGAVVLILLLVALLRGNSSGAAATASRTDRVTVTKSTSSDTDVV